MIFLLSSTMCIINQMIEFSKSQLMTHKESTVCAILYNKHNIISIGFNTVQTSAKICGHRVHVPSIHAEYDCINKCYLKQFKEMSDSKRVKKSKLCSANMIIIRLNKQNGFGFSQPCKECLKFLRNINFLNLKKITFMDKNMCVLTEKIEDINDSYRSLGWKLLLESKILY